MIIMIDNKDSFTYNIVDYIEQEYSGEVKVIDVERLSIEKVRLCSPEAIVISPGPGAPDDYPILNEILKIFATSIPVLGVCLGFQQIITYYGGDIIKSGKAIHGHTTRIQHNGENIFKGLPESFNVMRYHSLCANAQTFPAVLEITASNCDGMIMAFAHQTLPIYGLQYHPESILSEFGLAQIALFIEIVEDYHANPI